MLNNMAGFGNLTYNENYRPFIGLPIEDIRQTVDILDQRYHQNSDFYDELDVMASNLSVLDKDQAHLKNRIDAIRNGAQETVDKGDWEFAGAKVKKLYKDFATDKPLNQSVGNYKAWGEYSTTIDKEAAAKKWSEDETNLFKSLSLSRYEGVTTDENGNVKGIFNGYNPSEKADVIALTMKAIGDKWESDETPTSGYSDGGEGYYIVKNGSKQFVSKQEVSKFVDAYIAQSPEIQATLRDVAYLSQDPKYALQQFGTLYDSNLSNYITNEKNTFNPKTTNPATYQKKYDEWYKSKVEEFNTNLFGTKDMSGIGIDEYINPATGKKEYNYDKLNVGALSGMNSALTINNAKDVISDKYAFTKEKAAISLHNNELWLYKAKHALDEEWAFPTFQSGQGIEEKVTGDDVNALGEQRLKLQNDRKLLEQQLKLATTDKQRNTINNQLSQLDIQYNNLTNNIDSYMAKGDPAKFISEYSTLGSFNNMVIDVLKSVNPQDLTTEERIQLVNYIKGYNDIKSTSNNKIAPFENITNVYDLTALNNIDNKNSQFIRATDGNRNDVVNILSKLYNTLPDVKNIITDHRRTATTSIYNDIEVRPSAVVFTEGNNSWNPIRGVNLIDGGITTRDALKEYTNGIEGNGAMGLSLGLIYSADKDDGKGIKSTQYTDWTKGEILGLAGNATYVDKNNVNIRQWASNLEGKAYVKMGGTLEKDGDLVGGFTPTTGHIKLIPAYEAFGGSMYSQVSFLSDKDEQLYDIDGNPLVKYVRNVDQGSSRSTALNFAIKGFQAAVTNNNDNEQRVAVKLFGNTNYIDLTNYEPTKYSTGKPSILPYRTLMSIRKDGSVGPDQGYVGFIKTDLGFTAYMTKQTTIGGKINTEIDVTRPIAGNDGDNEYGSVQELIYNLSANDLGISK